ncbi:MAG TPA: CoA-transferase [Chloroflexota bacterium]|jgi:glutaconate CoA-transferase subunit B|nr:CoA-transferase [Chloroflexota bacterium]
MPEQYSAQELMVVAAAREIREDEVVFVGMRLPLLAFGLAKRTHAPHAIGLFENGLVRDRIPPPALYTMSDAPNVRGAAWATGLLEVMSVLQRGDVDLGFIGGAEVDRFGNINTTVIGSPDQPTIKLPGSGGGADIACLAQRLVSLMEHEPRRLRQRVDFITSPGYGDGSPDWRARQGLVRGGPAAVITTLGVLRFDPSTREACLASYHPFTSPEAVQAATGWPLRLADDLQPTAAPTAAELRLIREADPHGFWTR